MISSVAPCPRCGCYYTHTRISFPGVSKQAVTSVRCDECGLISAVPLGSVL